MKHPSNILSVMALLSGMAVSVDAGATNGLFLPGYGARSVGMGGTSIAISQGAMDPASNPANIAGMGEKLEIGAGIFNPPRRAYVDAEGSFFGDKTAEMRSERDWFLIPSAGYTVPLNSDLTFGVTAYGNGLGVYYKPNGYDFNEVTDGHISINLVQMIVPFTLAYKADETLSYGASFVFAAQAFKADGFGSFSSVTSDLDNYTDNGLDYSYGAGVRLGITKKYPGKNLTLGGYYASRTYMTEFDDYRGLFAEQGDLDIPSHFGVGIAYEITPRYLVAMDLVRIQWSEVAAIGNKGPEVYTGETLSTAAAGEVGQLGRDDGMGFGWEDQTVIKIGFRYQYTTDTDFSIGFNYGKTPIPQDQLAFGVIGPAVTEKHLSLGYGTKLNGYTLFGAKEAELNISYLHAFKNKMSGLSPLGTRESDGQTFAGYAEFEMYQNQLEISYGLKF